MESMESKMPVGIGEAEAGIAISLADLLAISASGPESESEVPLKSMSCQRGATVLMLLAPGHGRDGLSDIG